MTDQSGSDRFPASEARAAARNFTDGGYASVQQSGYGDQPLNSAKLPV